MSSYLNLIDKIFLNLEPNSIQHKEMQANALETVILLVKVMKEPYLEICDILKENILDHLALVTGIEKKKLKNLLEYCVEESIENIADQSIRHMYD